MALSWDAVTKSSDRGYLDPNAVTYNVCDLEGNEIAKNIKDTNVDFTLPIVTGLTRCQYYVCAVYEGRESDKTYTDILIIGEATPPYTVDFEDDSCLDFFTVIDNNSDGEVWALESTDDNQHVNLMYNSSMASDDYLITSPIRLRGGEIYRVSIDAWTGSSEFVPEKVEVLYGDAPTVEALTNIIIIPTELYETSAKEISGYITPIDDMVVYIGIHGISDADMVGLNIDNFKVSAGLNSMAPAGVTDIDLIRDPRGELKVTVKASLPTIDFTGNPVADVNRIDILRDGTIINSVTKFENSAFEVVDDAVPDAGIHLYSFIPYNKYGEGETVSKSVFVGFASPGSATNLKIEQTVPGDVHVSWDAPETDMEGNPIPADVLQYNIYNVKGNDLVLVYEAITETEFTTTAVEEGQEFVYYAILPQITANNTGNYAYTEMIPVGIPYSIPWKYTFDNDSFDNFIMGSNSDGGAQWDVYNYERLGIEGVDDDNFAAIRGTGSGTYADLFTGLISLDNTERPQLTFYTYKIGDDDENAIEIFVTCDGDTKQVFNYSHLENETVGYWKKIRADLSEYTGKTVQITFRGISNTYIYTLIDNISIDETLDYDLAVARLIAPEYAEVGKEFTVYATVSNDGIKSSEDFSLTFYRNGEEIDKHTKLSLAAGETRTFQLEQTLNAMSDIHNDYTLHIDFASDQKVDNNTSEAVSVKTVESSLNGVTDLKGNKEDGGFKLTWKAPEPSTFTPDAVTESFENMNDNETVLAPWTSIDVDGEPIGSLGDVTWDLLGTTQGFFVIDGVDGQLGASDIMLAHSGNKFAASCFLYYPDVQRDDWLVSPELYGGPQTITFYANSFQEAYPDKIEILYSKDGMEIEDFVPVSKPMIVPGTTGYEVNYTKFTAVLPDGAKHFAIRSYAKEGFYLMIDDIEYIPVNGVSSLEILGYNVYRDGEKLNEIPITDTEYTDYEGGNAGYCVTVVFNKGESRRSNIVNNVVTGISGITTGPNVSIEENDIVVTEAGNMEVAIFTTDGNVLRRAIGDTRINVVPGVYLVRIGKKVFKVIV